MRGSISKLQGKSRTGFILGEDGCEVYFDRSGMGLTNFASLSVGQWVDYDVQSGPDRLRATNIRVSRVCSHVRAGRLDLGPSIL